MVPSPCWPGINDFLHLSIPNPLSLPLPAVCSQACSGLLRGNFINTFKHHRVWYQRFAMGQRERNKKKNNGHNAPSSACLTTNLCLFLEAEHYINAWERLFQLAWETAGFWCCSKAAGLLLRSEGQRQWLSVPSDALWALGTLWPREETQSWPKPPPGTMIQHHVELNPQQNSLQKLF